MKDCFSLSIFFCSILAVFAKTSTKSNTTGNIQLSDVSNSVPDFHVFNWRLCKALHDVEKNNAVISSISIKLVLLILYEGALGNTAKQIERIVGFSGNKQKIRERYSQKLQSLQSHGKDDYELDIGTRLFMDVSVLPKNEFFQTVTKWYNSSFEMVNFRKPLNAINSINQWAENITHGRIQQFITESQTYENTVLLLLSAIYFKGYWTNPFNKDLTKIGTFYLNSKTTVNVPLMTSYDNFKTSTIPSLNARLICLPYQGNKFAMFIILPDSIDGLDDLVNKINPSLLGESLKNMKMSHTKVMLPKFNFEYTSILGPLLQKLGITDIFGAKSNLTNVGNGFFVSNILQKAGLEVNEQGSIAHAATEVDINDRFGTSVEVEFEVNRPFLFMIEDITMDTIVFVGQVTNPVSQGSPIVSIPVANSPTVKPVPEDVDFKINLKHDVNFQRYTYFDSELFQELSFNQPDSNFVASPAGIKSILSLLSEGARGNTLKQLNNVLRLPIDKSALHNLLRINQFSMKSSLIDSIVVNYIFVKNKNSISAYFKDTAIDLYSANISEINYSNIEASIKTINENIFLDSKGLLNNIISKDDFVENSELLLANVLYFKGDWLIEFNESNTKQLCFYTTPNVCKEINIMNLQDKINYEYISDINAQVFELLYKDSNFSMVVLLPDENITFVQLLKDLQHNPLSKIVNSLHKRTVNLYLPQFQMNYSTKLSTVLKKLEYDHYEQSLIEPVSQTFYQKYFKECGLKIKNPKTDTCFKYDSLTVQTTNISCTEDCKTEFVNKRKIHQDEAENVYETNGYASINSNEMGLTSIFDWNANLASIFNPEKEVFVKDVMHKVIIEVNEKGSRASAVTVVSVIPLSNIPELPIVTVNVNRPFAFFIFNRITKSVLFSGQVHDVNSDILTQHINLMDTTKKINDGPIQYSQNLSKYQQPQTKDKHGVKYNG